MSDKEVTYCRLDLRTPSSSCSSSTFFCILSFSLARILTLSSVSFVRTLKESTNPLSWYPTLKLRCIIFDFFDKIFNALYIL